MPATLNGTNLTITGTYDFTNALNVGSSAGSSQSIDTTIANGTITGKDSNGNTYSLQISRIGFSETTNFIPQTAVDFYEGNNSYPNFSFGSMVPASYSYYDNTNTLQFITLKEVVFTNVNGTFASEPQNFSKWQTWLNNKEVTPASNVYSLTHSLTNLANGNVSFTVTPDTGYSLPSSVTVSNGTLVSYDSSTGVIVVSGDSAEITVDCPQAVSTLNFSIQYQGNITTYQAETGMTWAQWCSSAYNTDSYHIDPNNNAVSDSQGYYHIMGVVGSDTITSTIYTLQMNGGDD